MFMNGFQLLFKDTSDIYDYVDIRENYVSVTNTQNDYRQTMTQYGLTNAGFVSPEKTEIRMDIGEIRLYATDTKNTSPSPGPDLRIDGDGSITFRVSAGGTLDSLYGKNAQGELTAIDRDVFYSTGSTVPVSNGGTGLTTFGGAGREIEIPRIEWGDLPAAAVAPAPDLRTGYLIVSERRFPARPGRSIRLPFVIMRSRASAPRRECQSA